MKSWLILISLFLILQPGLVKAVEAEAVDPTQDLRCWTEDICIMDADKNGTPDGRFDKASDTAKEKCGTGGYGFCYPPATNFELGVGLPITGTLTTSVSDLGDYIGKTYKFLLSISVIFAVLMIMVGGIQYVSSPGGSEVSKAKERITRAITGLVLLMCATLILFTINPHLISLEMPAIPKTRTVFFISESTTCETLVTGGGYTLNPTSGQCGSPVSKITAIDGKEIAEADQKTCRWSACTPTTKSCIDLEPTDKCIDCINATGATSGLTISSSLCAQLSIKDVITNGVLKNDNECFLTTDSDLGASSSQPKCALLAVDCTTVSTCENYATQNVLTSGTTSLLNKFRGGEGSDMGLETICTADKCGTKAKTGKTCTFFKGTGAGVDQCISK